MSDITSVLERLRARYAELQSYADRGVIHRLKRVDEPPDETPFRTWFVRPNRIRLDWSYHHPYPPLRHIVTKYAVCSDGIRTWRWQDRPEGLEEETEIGLAFAGAATVDVPNLLLPQEIGAFAFDMLNDLRLETTELASVPCYSVVGEHPEGGTYRVWLDQADFMVRKVRTDWRTPVEENDIYSGISETTFLEIDPNGHIEGTVFEKIESLLAAG